MEQFRDIHHEDREPKPSQMPHKYGNANRSALLEKSESSKHSVVSRNNLNSLAHQTMQSWKGSEKSTLNGLISTELAIFKKHREHLRNP